MKSFNTIFLIIFIILNYTSTQAQYKKLKDNMSIPSNSIVKIAAGNYNFTDSAKKGVVRIIKARNVIIDGDSVSVSGAPDTAGYMLFIDSSQDIIIKNFKLVSGYFYAGYVHSSDSVQFLNCNFSNNKADSSLPVALWNNSGSADGGGILIDQCTNVMVNNCTIQFNNEALSVYNSKKIRIDSNHFSWNTGCGIRLSFSDSCEIAGNTIDFTHKPMLDSAGSGALMMTMSNNSVIKYNDLSNSERGVLLSQYGYSETNNNNNFNNNDCSNSTFNAFEATYAGGNIFANNKADNSRWGFWLAYSFNTILDGNEIIGNCGVGPDHGGAVAIDRGTNNQISYNTINNNYYGIHVWESAPPEPSYENSVSGDYYIHDNKFLNNQYGMNISPCLHLYAYSNQFNFNFEDIYIEGQDDFDTLTGNRFGNAATYYVFNNSLSNVLAQGNYFPTDSLMVDGKMFGKQKDAFDGVIEYLPIIPSGTINYETNTPADLTEPTKQWSYLASDGGQTSLSWDSTNKQSGLSALKITTASNADVGVHYWSDSSTFARWDLSNNKYINISFKSLFTNPQNPFGFQSNYIILGDSRGNYFKYSTDESMINQSIGRWKSYQIPLSGDNYWVRTFTGDVRLSDISYIEVHASSWTGGFQLWIDGLSFGNTTDVEDQTNSNISNFGVYPNPATDIVNIKSGTSNSDNGKLYIRDCYGRTIDIIASTSGQTSYDVSRLSSGVYYVTTGNNISTKSGMFAVVR